MRPPILYSTLLAAFCLYPTAANAEEKTLLDLASKRAMLLWGPVGGLAILAAAGFWDLRRRVDRTMDRNLEGAAAETATA